MDVNNTDPTPLPLCRGDSQSFMSQYLKTLAIITEALHMATPYLGYWERMLFVNLLPAGSQCFFKKKTQNNNNKKNDNNSNNKNRMMWINHRATKTQVSSLFVHVGDAQSFVSG